jgi:outer membrane murein-binding lipoprotein Lpp
MERPLVRRRIKNMKRLNLAALLLSVLFVAGCSDSKPNATKSETPEKKVAETETGRFALQKMLPVARFWAADAKPIQLQSSPSPDSNGQDGKSAYWRAVLGSASRGKSEPFSWSGAPDSKGVDHGVEDSWSPNNRSTQAWELAFLKVDTDKAIEVANQHGGKQLLEKDPKMLVMYFLGWNAQSSELDWYVIYGGSTSNAKLTILVNASSGGFVRKE